MTAWRNFSRFWKRCSVAIGVVFFGVVGLTGCQDSSSPLPRPPSQSSDSTAPVLSKEVKPVWLPIKVDRACRLDKLTISVGDYFVFPEIEIREGNPEIKRYIVASRRDIRLEEINESTGRTQEGEFAVFVKVIGAATLSTTFSSSQARFASNDQIATIWFGLAGNNREWSSEPLTISQSLKSR